MRKFYLQNESGERQGLNGEDGIRLGSPAGLGVSFASIYSDLENDFYRLAQQKTQQGQVTCSLTFVRQAYSRYTRFVNWCAAAKTLYLVYKPETTEYFRLVQVDYLTKTELGHGKWLEVPAAFKCLTPWYLPVPAELGLTVRSGNRKEYKWDPLLHDYAYRYTEDLRYGGDAAGEISARIEADGHLPAAVVLRYTGAITDPTIRLVGTVTGKVYGVCALTAQLNPGETLELSTLYEDSHVIKIAPGGTETSLLDALDLSKDPYFHIPTSEPVILSLESDATFSGSGELLVYYYFRSV